MSGLTELHESRIDAVKQGLAERGLEALWVEPSVGLFYLTGLDPVSVERLFTLVIPAEGVLRLVVPLLLRDECEHIDVAEHFVWDDGEGPDSAIERALKGLTRLHVQDSLPFWTLRNIMSVRPELDVDADPGILPGLRERKDGHEVDLIRRSGAITDETVEWVGSLHLEGMAERELAGRIQARYLEQGYKPSPYGLVASGPNAAMPHYVGGDVRIGIDKPLLMDFGGAVGGYWSDITRIYFPGELDSQIAEAYDVVCRAYDAAFRVLEPGISCHDVDHAARAVIESAGYGERFIHRTGHGLGLEVHEPPYLRAGNDQRLDVGHVFSVEPGIYVPGRFGVRYENIVHLGVDGPEAMNHSPRRHLFRP
jgi:Xaa-Pro aminopeptidase